MTPRDDEPPRRGREPRRGASSDEGRESGRGFGGIGEARAYTPRGRTVRDGDQRTRSPRAGRTNDPFRPALQVLDGGRSARDRRRGEDTPPPRQRDEEPQERGRGTRVRAQQPERERQPRTGRTEARSGRTEARSGRTEARPSRTEARPARGETRSGRTEARTGRAEATRATAGGGRTRATANPRRGGAPASPRRGGAPARTVSKTTRRPVPAAPPEPPKLANSTRRLRLGTVLALTLFAAIGVRLIVLQVADSPAQAQSLEKQRSQRLTEVVLPAPRGSILDENGAELAHSVEARYIYGDPEMIGDPAATAAKLSPLLGVPQSKLASLMQKKKRPGGGPSRFEYLARGVDVATADQIRRLDLDGIGSGRDEVRVVPGADLAANLIGFTGDNHTGLEGLEARYDDLLKGTDGEKVYEVGNGDLAKEIPGGYRRETAAKPGSSLQLTINSDLQFQVQRYLQEYMEEKKATVGGAVVIDIRTGEVKAQASYPTYNAQKALDYDSKDRVDAATNMVSDPGSTHKAFVIGAAMEEGLITKDSTVTVAPGVKVGGTWFPDEHTFATGSKIPVSQVLAYSSNVGTIGIGKLLGKDKLYEYQQKFGLGRPTNEGMPGEASGQLLAPEDWSGSSWGSVPIGYSVSATLIQMAAGYAAIANDGVYIQPHLIKATISGKDGTVTPADPPETHRVLSASTSKDLREMMESVVGAEHATGTQAAVAGYRVAGKTGTGNKPIEGQYTNHNASSFIGMAPAENPRYVVAVFADVPQGTTGGDVAAPAFSKMMAATLTQYHVPPSSTPAPKFDWMK
ncbi:penicillin-binding transpeptidase domain-containing protein [Actinoplanes sp. RD1]|uniref:penicillin-binding transpeptidase domain-containing protein n=1 Tax=Actinoplanes sp. RD1 TaxID=3064538 RepID=UPI002742348E|nr:penicillin-binding transpeptidase domain-containing protein [Actinoplanes sp. RD1]